MKIIRQKTFETNSSSSHSISISDTKILNDIPIPDENGIVTLKSGEFGWEDVVYDDFYDKAAYLIVYIRDWVKTKLKEKFRNILENLIKEKSGCIEIKYENLFWDREEKSHIDENGETITYYSYLGKGYIDHQSVENQDRNYLFDVNDIDYVEGELENYLFNNNSFLQTGNDSDDYNWTW